MFILTSIDGVELYHKSFLNNKDLFIHIKELCNKFNLLKIVGSDRYDATVIDGKYFEIDCLIDQQMIEEDFNKLIKICSNN